MGYIALTEDELTYNYYANNYQGNVKEVYSIAGTNATTASCIQRMQYYPSGLPWENNFGADEQPYKYGGKEFVEMHSLDEYDSEARWYYPAIMRTTTMDPLCEKYYSISPYAWCGNNPVNFVDPDGKACKVVKNGSTYVVKAKYYVRKNDTKALRAAQKAVDKWNSLQAQYKGHDVSFKLKVIVTENDPKVEAQRSLDGMSNSFEIVDYIPLTEEQKAEGNVKVNGRTERNREIQVRTDRADTETAQHEVGHTLMNLPDEDLEHSDKGIMTKTSNDPNRDESIDQDIIDKIIESNDVRTTLLDKIRL